MPNICRGCGRFIENDDLLCWSCDNPELDDLMMYFGGKGGDYKYEERY